ncbi:MAG TPA: hypothetical protein VNP98_17175 [Chthoniobacterales bacterium]|nr:hypothetical protein [Chthoniobacterales bacterium]
MTAQLDLELSTKRRAPRVTQADVDWFIDQLRGKTEWLSAAHLGATTEAQRRRLRKIAEAAKGKIISFPGSPGYKLLDNCTLKELRRCDAAVRSQTRRMEAKLKPIWRAMHKLELVEQGGAA